jgi:hypothetical protein
MSRFLPKNELMRENWVFARAKLLIYASNMRANACPV